MFRNFLGWVTIAVLIDVLLVASLACQLRNLPATAAASSRMCGV